MQSAIFSGTAQQVASKGSGSKGSVLLPWNTMPERNRLKPSTHRSLRYKSLILSGFDWL